MNVGKPRLIVRADNNSSSKERTLIAYDVAVLLGQLLHEFDLAVHHRASSSFLMTTYLTATALPWILACVDA